MILGSWYLLKSAFKNNDMIFWTDIDIKGFCHGEYVCYISDISDIY